MLLFDEIKPFSTKQPKKPLQCPPNLCDLELGCCTSTSLSPQVSSSLEFSEFKFRVEGLGFRVKFRVEGLGFRV